MLTTVAPSKKSARRYDRPYLDQADEKIISSLHDIATAFYSKAQKAMTDLDVMPDEIHRLVTQSRSYASKAYSYEKKLRLAYEEKMRA